MPSFIPKNFTPNQSVYETAQRVGAPVEFVDYELPNFRNYFEDLKERKIKKGRKESWPMTCGVWMRRAWQGKAGREWEETRHRQRKWGGERTDLFNATFDKIQNPDYIKGSKINGSVGDKALDPTCVTQAGTAKNLQSPGRGAAAAPINGTVGKAFDGAPLTDRPVSGAAPIDPLEALKEMKKILESA